MMETIENIVQFFQTGGTFMYPILIVFAFGVAICIERYIKLSGIGKANRKVWDQVHPLLDEGNFEEARNSISEDGSAIASLLNMGLERQGSVRRRDDIEIAMEESMMEIIPSLEKRTPYIALFANICTLLGLLGTIMGLIEAFTAVANADPAEKADLLSASISVAMNTTAFGLHSLFFFVAPLRSLREIFYFNIPFTFSSLPSVFAGSNSRMWAING